ncbi:MAG: SUMF1/EgtB/PvdO family nonheme iron enzyme [Planctomycetota bacterium]
MGIPPRPRRTWRAPAAGLSLLAAACGPGTGEGSRALWELERLAFVPAGPATIPGFVETHADCSLERAIVIDLFEFSRLDGAVYGFERAAGEFRTDAATPGEEKRNWPLFLSLPEAQDLAARRGMRLPTAREWLHVATGDGTQAYPFHATSFQQGIANTLELDVGTPTPIGTFERGKSLPFGCYDLLGNVWEWVVDLVPGYEDLHFHAPEVDPQSGEALECSVLGGGFDSVERRTFGPALEAKGPRLRVHARRQPRGTLSPAVGARMCADAEAYLWAKAGEWGSGAEARRRIRTTGGRWARTAGREVVGTFLDALAGRPGAPAALRWLAEGARE